MAYTYKNGYREGVAFVFLKDNTKILVEHRKVGNNVELFFTSGSIENKDYNQKQDYKLQALFREVKEEFRDNIKIKEYVYLNEVFAEQVKIVFYVYLITDWQGEMPDYTFEDGANDSLITWEDLSEYKRLFVYDTAYKICEDIKGYLVKGENHEKIISNK